MEYINNRRPNNYAGNCRDCNAYVEAGLGKIAPPSQGLYRLLCFNCFLTERKKIVIGSVVDKKQERYKIPRFDPRNSAFVT